MHRQVDQEDARSSVSVLEMLSVSYCCKGFQNPVVEGIVLIGFNFFN